MLSETITEGEVLKALSEKYRFVLGRVNEVMAITEVILREARNAFDDLERNHCTKTERVKIAVYITFYSLYMGQFYFEVVPVLLTFYLGFFLLKTGRLSEPRFAKFRKYIMGWIKSEYWYHDILERPRPSDPVKILKDTNMRLEKELPPNLKEINNQVIKNLDRLWTDEKTGGSTKTHLRMWVKHRMLVECTPFCFEECMYPGSTDENRFNLPWWTEIMAVFRKSVDRNLPLHEDEFPRLKDILKSIVCAIDDLGI